MISVLGCVLLVVVELVVEVAALLLPCVLRGVRNVVAHRSPLVGVRGLS